MLAWTGLRIGEALGLIAIDEDLARRLWRVVADKPTDQPIFATSVGSPWDQSTARRAVVRAGKAAGVKISPHCLRHTRITHMLQAGNRTRDVADYAGDREDTIVVNYSHAIADTRMTLPRRVELPEVPAVPGTVEAVA